MANFPRDLEETLTFSEILSTSGNLGYGHSSVQIIQFQADQLSQSAIQPVMRVDLTGANQSTPSATSLFEPIGKHAKTLVSPPFEVLGPRTGIQSQVFGVLGQYAEPGDVGVNVDRNLNESLSLSDVVDRNVGFSRALAEVLGNPQNGIQGYLWNLKNLIELEKDTFDSESDDFSLDYGGSDGFRFNNGWDNESLNGTNSIVSDTKVLTKTSAGWNETGFKKTNKSDAQSGLTFSIETSLDIKEFLSVNLQHLNQINMETGWAFRFNTSDIELLFDGVVLLNAGLYSAATIYTTKFIVNEDGNVEFWIQGGTEWPSDTRLFIDTSRNPVEEADDLRLSATLLNPGVVATFDNYVTSAPGWVDLDTNDVNTVTRTQVIGGRKEFTKLDDAGLFPVHGTYREVAPGLNPGDEISIDIIFENFINQSGNRAWLRLSDSPGVNWALQGLGFDFNYNGGLGTHILTINNEVGSAQIGNAGTIEDTTYTCSFRMNKDEDIELYIQGGTTWPTKTLLYTYGPGTSLEFNQNSYISLDVPNLRPNGTAKVSLDNFSRTTEPTWTDVVQTGKAFFRTGEGQTGPGGANRYGQINTTAFTGGNDYEYEFTWQGSQLNGYEVTLFLDNNDADLSGGLCGFNIGPGDVFFQGSGLTGNEPYDATQSQTYMFKTLASGEVELYIGGVLKGTTTGTPNLNSGNVYLKLRFTNTSSIGVDSFLATNFEQRNAVSTILVSDNFLTDSGIWTDVLLNNDFPTDPPYMEFRIPAHSIEDVDFVKKFDTIGDFGFDLTGSYRTDTFAAVPGTVAKIDFLINQDPNEAFLNIKNAEFLFGLQDDNASGLDVNETVGVLVEDFVRQGPLDIQGVEKNQTSVSATSTIQKNTLYSLRVYLEDVDQYFKDFSDFNTNTGWGVVETQGIVTFGNDEVTINHTGPNGFDVAGIFRQQAISFDIGDIIDFDFEHDLNTTGAFGIANTPALDVNNNRVAEFNFITDNDLTYTQNGGLTTGITNFITTPGVKHNCRMLVNPDGTLSALIKQDGAPTYTLLGSTTFSVAGNSYYFYFNHPYSGTTWTLSGDYIWQTDFPSTGQEGTASFTIQGGNLVDELSLGSTTLGTSGDYRGDLLAFVIHANGLARYADGFMKVGEGQSYDLVRERHDYTRTIFESITTIDAVRPFKNKVCLDADNFNGALLGWTLDQTDGTTITNAGFLEIARTVTSSWDDLGLLRGFLQEGRADIIWELDVRLDSTNTEVLFGLTEQSALDRTEEVGIFFDDDGNVKVRDKGTIIGSQPYASGVWYTIRMFENAGALECTIQGGAYGSETTIGTSTTTGFDTATNFYRLAINARKINNNDGLDKIFVENYDLCRPFGPVSRAITENYPLVNDRVGASKGVFVTCRPSTLVTSNPEVLLLEDVPDTGIAATSQRDNLGALEILRFIPGTTLGSPNTVDIGSIPSDVFSQGFILDDSPDGVLLRGAWQLRLILQDTSTSGQYRVHASLFTVLPGATSVTKVLKIGITQVTPTLSPSTSPTEIVLDWDQSEAGETFINSDENIYVEIFLEEIAKPAGSPAFTQLRHDDTLGLFSRLSFPGVTDEPTFSLPLPTETLTFSDSLDTTKGYVRPLIETIIILDTLAISAGYDRQINEICQVLDLQVLAQVNVLFESITIGDLVDRLVVNNRELVETMTIVDTLDVSGSTVKNPMERIIIRDEVNAYIRRSERAPKTDGINKRRLDGLMGVRYNIGE